MAMGVESERSSSSSMETKSLDSVGDLGERLRGEADRIREQRFMELAGLYTYISSSRGRSGRRQLLSVTSVPATRDRFHGMESAAASPGAGGRASALLICDRPSTLVRANVDA